MKINLLPKITVFIFLLLTTGYAFAQKSDSLRSLYEAKLFGEMNSANNDSTHPYYYFYKAVYANACNKPDSSNFFLFKMLGKKKSPPKDVAFEWHKLEMDNYIRSFQFDKAEKSGKYYLKNYKSKFTKDEIKSTTYSNLIWKALKNRPSQKIDQPAIDSIPFTRDMAGLINFSVTINNQTLPFVFDTGAGLSVFTESYANKLGIQILPDSGIKVAGFNNIYNDIKMGIVPHVQIGKINIYNEPVLVFSDEAFTFANGAYKINGIIGFPIAKGLGRIQIEQQQIVFTKHLQDDPALPRNFFLETLHPILILNYKGRNLPFGFDTGANTSTLSRAFYEAYKSEIDKEATLIETTRASAGGATNHKMLQLETAAFILHNSGINIPKLVVDPENHHVNSEKLFGNIGQDLLKQYKKVIIDFGNSHFHLEN